MSFINKFKNKKAEDQVPEGVKVEYSSFGQPQSGYNPNLVQQNMNSSQSSSSNGNHNNNKQQSASLAQTSVWNDDQPAKLNNTTTKQTKGKPNFMQKSQPQQPAPVQQTVENTQIQKPTATVAPAQRQEINLKIENQPVAKKIKFEIKNEFDLLDDNDLNFPELEFQKKLVNDIVAPGGIRIKQQEDILNTFADDCQSFHPCVIGSLLINKFFSNEQTVVKQRAIYASEILVKKHQKYQEYFKRQQFMVQKSQQFNISDSKFVQLSNQLLAVVSNPSLEIKEQADINFNFSQGNDLSKFSKKSEQLQQQPQAIQKNNQQQVSNVNLIDEIDNQNEIDLLGDQQVSAKQSKPKSLFENLNKKKTAENQIPAQQTQSQTSQVQQTQQQPQPAQNAGGESKMKQFLKFKGKQNNENNQNNLNRDGDLLNLIDEQTNSNGKTNAAGSSSNHQGLQDQFSLLNLYTNENKETQNHNQNYNNFQYPNSNNNNNAPQFNQFNPPHMPQIGMYPPQFPHPGFNGQHISGYPYQNNGYPQYPQPGYQNYGQQMQPNIYGYNNPTTQNTQAFKTIHMDFSGQNNNHQEKQLLDLNNFKIDDNTPNQKNNQQVAEKNRQQINEGAFDFISL
ncbi:hypothetical protein ABPG74_003321 [Tetrahymena malaccensis]